MTQNPTSARASPEVKISDGHRRLIYEVYEEVDKRIDVLGDIEQHIDFLIKNRSVAAAEQFLREEEAALKEYAAQKPKRERRNFLKLVIPTTVAALIASAKLAGYFLGS